MSKALGFSVGNTHVVTVTALWFSSPFSQFTFGTFSIFVFLFVMFGLFGCAWLAGQVVCDWVSILVSGVFLRGFACVLGVFRIPVAPLYLFWAIDSCLG